MTGGKKNLLKIPGEEKREAGGIRGRGPLDQPDASEKKGHYWPVAGEKAIRGETGWSADLRGRPF